MRVVHGFVEVVSSKEGSGLNFGVGQGQHEDRGVLELNRHHKCGGL